MISGFSEHFIKTGIFPVHYGEVIQRLRKHRELGDYGYQLNVDAKEATEDVKAASEIVERLATYLRPFLA